MTISSSVACRAPGRSMITGCAPVTLYSAQLNKNVLVVGDAAQPATESYTGRRNHERFEAADLAADAVLGCGSNDRKLRAYSRQWAGNQRRQQKVYRLRDMIVNSWMMKSRPWPGGRRGFSEGTSTVQNLSKCG